MKSRWAAVLAAVALVACGGGGGGGAESTASPTPAAAVVATAPPTATAPAAACAASASCSTDSAAQAAAAASAAGTAPTPAAATLLSSDPGPDVPTTRNDAFRFLTQATFGPTGADIDRVMAIGYRAWIDEQFAKPQTLHRTRWEAADAAAKAASATAGAGTADVLAGFYAAAVTGEDQLRQRVAHALAQIFVVSMVDESVASYPRGVAGYLDTLAAQATGSYRGLLEGVARHPVMGLYLSFLRNQKEDPVKGRVPDENFAREAMQLFTIGLHPLALDGSPNLAADSYGADDISGLARVFTGWSWAGPDTTDGRFTGATALRDADRDWQPMQAYAQFHSTGEKRFLGQTVAAGRNDAAADLRLALDTLAAHANVGPFIGRQLIQRLVTSHPGTAYVRRVAATFDDNGSGVRGDMKAVIRAVLLDAEARTAGAAAAPAFGKLREPVLRLTAALRALGAKSDSGRFLIGTTDDPGSQLGQSPLRSPSVFNFYRPGYVPAGTEAGAAGLTVPEMQLTHETTVAGYANYMRAGVQAGFGVRGTSPARADVQLSLDDLRSRADDASGLVQRACALLLGAQANAALQAEMVAAVQSVVVPAPKASPSNQAAIDLARNNRVWMAVYLALVSPEFIVQK